jgi:ABC-type multidrug transport system ATPase subunit
MTASTLVADDLGVRTGTEWMFDRLSLSVAPGQIVRVLAPPGPGRTMCALALAGRVPADHGTLRLAGATLYGPHPRIGIGWVQGTPPFDGRETIGEVLQRSGLSRGGEARGTDLAVLSLGSHARYRASGQPLLMQALLGSVSAAAFSPDIVVVDLPPGKLEHRAAADAVVTSLSRRGIGVVATTMQHLTKAEDVVLNTTNVDAA